MVYTYTYNFVAFLECGHTAEIRLISTIASEIVVYCVRIFRSARDNLCVNDVELSFFFFNFYSKAVRSEFVFMLLLLFHLSNDLLMSFFVLILLNILAAFSFSKKALVISIQI